MNSMTQSRIHLPFSKEERIIIAFVVLAHLAFIVPFNFGLTPKPPNYLNDERVLANLLPPDSPSPPKQSAPPAPKIPVEAPKPTPKPTPKPEVKKAEKTPTPTPTPAPSPTQSSPTPAPPTPSAKSSESTQSATVAPSTGGGGVSGTPIQTDIGKLIVVYQPGRSLLPLIL